jgi:predicted ATP-grasp superfamily ATP-dependent carboligase
MRGEENLIPVILGGYVNGLSIARSLGYEGINSIVIDHKKDIALYSKFVKGYRSPKTDENEKEFVDFLIGFGKELPNKGIFFATEDIWLLPIVKHREILERYYLYPFSNKDVIMRCLDKSQLYEAAQKIGIPIPWTKIIESLDELKEFKKFPCVVKPAITVGFLDKMTSGTTKTTSLNNIGDLDRYTNALSNANLSAIKLIIQEEVVGPVDGLYTISSYSNSNGDIVAYSVGHKIHQYPPNAGTITSGRLDDNEEIYTLAKKLIKELRFCGIANTEFKKDIRDGTFKLIEINPRPGMWNYSAFKAGINLPYIAYREVMGKKQRAIKSNSDYNRVWIMLLEDFLTSIYLNKRSGHSEYNLSIREWLNSIKGQKIYPIFDINDIKPWLYYFPQFLKRALRLKKEGFLWK